MEQEDEEDHDDNDLEGVEEGSLIYLAYRGDLQDMLARLKELARPVAVRELLYRNKPGDTALHFVFYPDPSLELVRVIWDVMKEDDPLKTNLFAIADNGGEYPLHFCAAQTTNVEVLNFAIDKFPHALVRRNEDDGRTPLNFAQHYHSDRANHAAILRCFEESTARYPALLNQITAKCCLVAMKRNGMTEYVARTPLNDLTQPQFVFMVLDMMKNCAMQPLAEQTMSYVGANVRLPIEMTNTNFEVKRLRQEVWEVKQDVSETKKITQQVAQLDDRMSKLEQALAEQEGSRKRDLAEQEASRKRDLEYQEANRKRDHDAVMASHAALMAALVAARGLPADQGGDGGGESSQKKRKENGA